MDSDVFVAPVATPKPTTLEPGEAWESIGWITEDGVSEGLSVDSEKFKLWQGGKTGKTKTTGTEKTFTVAAAETSPLVFELSYGTEDDAITVTDGIAEIALPDGVKTVARAVAFKFVDGDVTYIRYNTRAEITDRGDVDYSNGSLAARSLTFDLVGVDSWLTNDPAFVGAA
jgi:hypothetical protein